MMRLCMATGPISSFRYSVPSFRIIPTSVSLLQTGQSHVVKSTSSTGSASMSDRLYLPLIAWYMYVMESNESAPSAASNGIARLEIPRT